MKPFSLSHSKEGRTRRNKKKKEWFLSTTLGNNIPTRLETYEETAIGRDFEKNERKQALCFTHGMEEEVELAMGPKTVPDGAGTQELRY